MNVLHGFRRSAKLTGQIAGRRAGGLHTSIRPSTCQRLDWFRPQHVSTLVAKEIVRTPVQHARNLSGANVVSELGKISVCASRLEECTHRQTSLATRKPSSELSSLPSCALAAAPIVAAPARYGDTTLWFFESCVGIGSIKMGVPGVVAQCFFVSPIPIIRRIIAERSVGGLPLLPYSSMFVSGLCWCSYGLLIDNSAVWLCNAPPVFMGAIYTAIFMKYCPADAKWLPGTKSMHLAGMALALAFCGGMMTQEPEVAAPIIGSAATCIVVIMFMGPLTVIRNVIKEQSTKNLPFPMMVATVTNCALWTFYGAEIIHDPFITIPNALGLAAGLAQAALFMRYGICR